LNSIVENQTVKTLLQSITGVKPAVVSRQPRIANIERLRFFSAFAVASFHTHDWFPRSIGVVGFIILLLSYCAFVVNKPEPYGIAKVARRKARRLLKPWLFWSFIYGVLGLAKMIYENLSFSDVFSPTMLLTGTRTHLWFLPFAFVAALFLASIHRRIVGIPDSYTIIAAISIGALCIFGCSIIQSRLQHSTQLAQWIQGLPLPQWILGLPAIPLGFAIGRIKILQRAEDRKKYFLFVILSILTACVGCIVFDRLSHGTWLNYSSKFAIRYFASMVIFCSALHWRGTLDAVSASIASLSYGIYLVHPLVLVPFDQLGIAIQHPLLLLFLVLSISSLITFILKKTPLKQFV
jgi:surface polysaccharide O-acyltransferase-like enzyme